MIGRGKRPSIPAPKVGPGEKLVAVGLSGDRTIAATDQALYLGSQRIPWDAVDKANWQEPTLALLLRDSHGNTELLRLRLDTPGDLPDAIHALVTASVIVSRRIVLDGGRGAIVVARRAGDGSVRWHVQFEPGLDPGDPVLRARADAAVAELRDSLGI